MSDALSIWWVWMAAALILAILEVLAPGFIFLGFAIGAAVVGLIVLGPASLLSPPMLLLLFAALSLVAWLLLKRFFSMPSGQVKNFDHDIND